MKVRDILFGVLGAIYVSSFWCYNVLPDGTREVFLIPIVFGSAGLTVGLISGARNG